MSTTLDLGEVLIGTLRPEPTEGFYVVQGNAASFAIQGLLDYIATQPIVDPFTEPTWSVDLNTLSATQISIIEQATEANAIAIITPGIKTVIS